MNLFSYIDEVFLYKTLCLKFDIKQKFNEYENYKEFIQDKITDRIYDNSEFYNSIAPDNFFLTNWAEIVQQLSPKILKEYDINISTQFNDVCSRFVSGNLLDARFVAHLNRQVPPISFKFWGEKKIFKSLKDYQMKMVIEVLKQLRPQFGRVIIQMPTGSGKTRTGVEVVSHFIKEKSKVLWLSDTEELADQAFEAFTEVWGTIGLPNTSAINTTRTKIKTLSPAERSSIVFYSSTIQSLTSEDPLTKVSKAGIDYHNIGLIVFDEAHKAIAPTYQRLVDAILGGSNKQCRLLGLTATPGRVYDNVPPEFADEHNQNVLLSAHFNNKIVKLKDSQLETMNFLRVHGIIAELVVKEIEGIRLQNSGKNEKKIAIELAQNQSRNKIIINNIIDLISEHNRILVFANSIEHSKLLTLILTSLSIRVAHIDGETQNRSEIISRFKAGEIQVVINYGVLTTGYDDPQLECVMITRKTSSIVLYSQMIGRVLRGPKIGGTKTAKIVTIKDNIDGLISNDQIFSFFDGYFTHNENLNT